MRLILLGSPGAGKGTQAKLISKKYQIPTISTGDLFREAIKKNTPLGIKIKKIVNEGQLVPDDLVIELVKDRLQQADCEPGFLLDGFPRTISQAQALEKMLALDGVINIEVPDEVVMKRLHGRLVHPGSGRTYHVVNQPPRVPNKDDVTGEPLIQRPDDTIETIQKRLAIYHQQTDPLKDFYQKPHQNAQYVSIDGTLSIEDIKKQLFLILDDIKEVKS